MEYKRELKTDWKAKWIWLTEEKNAKNAWICFNKKVNIDTVPDELIAHIAAENKYMLYINGKCIEREGGLKRGPSPTGCFFDEIDIANHLNAGENLISILVWYWGNEVSYSSSDAGQGGMLFEAESIVSDKSWSVMKNPAFKLDNGKLQPNYRLPESNVYYDAREEIADWNKCSFDFSGWENATEYALGGEGCWGETYSRDIPLFKDYGLKDYLNSAEFIGRSWKLKKKITLLITPSLRLISRLKRRQAGRLS